MMFFYKFKVSLFLFIFIFSFQAFSFANPNKINKDIKSFYASDESIYFLYTDLHSKTRTFPIIKYIDKDNNVTYFIGESHIDYPDQFLGRAIISIEDNSYEIYQAKDQAYLRQLFTGKFNYLEYFFVIPPEIISKLQSVNENSEVSITFIKERRLEQLRKLINSKTIKAIKDLDNLTYKDFQFYRKEVDYDYSDGQLLPTEI